jgi:hypothetical protein
MQGFNSRYIVAVEIEARYNALAVINFLRIMTREMSVQYILNDVLLVDRNM